MAFEFFPRYNVGAGTYGDGWMKYPAVSVCKTGFAFNKPFCDAFGVKAGMSIMIGFDREQRKFGFKICGDHDTVKGGFVVSLHTNGISARCGQERHSNMFPDCIGHAYRAHLNPTERVIEVLLSPDNIV